MTAKALSAATSSQVLQRNSLSEPHHVDSHGCARQAVQALLQNRRTPDRPFALAELSFVYAPRYEQLPY
jgi:hypothetical protein